MAKRNMLIKIDAVPGQKPAPVLHHVDCFAIDASKPLDIRETVRVEYTLRNLLSDEWITATADNCRELAR